MMRTRKFLSGLKGKLLVWFLLIALLPLLVTSVLAYSNSRNALEKKIFSELTSINELKGRLVLHYFEELSANATLLAQLGNTRLAFERLNRYHDSSGARDGGVFDITTEEYKKIQAEIAPFFDFYSKTFGYYDMFFMCVTHGHVMHTYTRESDLGTNLTTGSLSNSGLARLWSKVIKQKKVVFEDFSIYAPSNSPAFFVGVPVKASDGSVIAVIAFQVGTDRINDLVNDATGLGRTGESLLIGDDLLVRSDSRFDNAFRILKAKIDTDAGRSAIKNASGNLIAKDYKGNKVIESYRALGLGENFATDFGWHIISKMDYDEAFAPVFALRNWVILIVVFSVVAVAFAALYLSGIIAGPMIRMSLVAKQVASGNLSVSPDEKTDDEIGDLSKSLQDMIATLRGMVSQILRTSERISVSSQELSSTAQQMNATTEEVSSTVQQISKGTESQAQRIDETQKVMEHVSAAISQVSVSAQHAANEAAGSLKISQKGSEAATETQRKVTKISEIVGRSVDSVKKLGERSDQIGEIVDVITSIADQTNLLALNAAIEAARAGEYGRGFAVVAEEVRKLAEASAKSAEEIEKLIKDVQQDTGDAVLSIQGAAQDAEEINEITKRLGSGLIEIVKSSERLAAMVEDVSSANQEQASSAKQVAKAVSDIASVAEETAAATEEASASSEEMTASMEELVSSAQELADMGIALRDMVGQFRLDSTGPEDALPQKRHAKKNSQTL